MGLRANQHQEFGHTLSTNIGCIGHARRSKAKSVAEIGPLDLAPSATDRSMMIRRETLPVEAEKLEPREKKQRDL